MRKLLLLSFFGVLAMVPFAAAQIEQPQAAASLASLTGTYTFQMSEMREYSIEYNWSGRQVGFCTNGVPVGYGCWDVWTYNLNAGTMVSDGAGHITSGTVTITKDPRSYKCNPKNNPTNPCPVIVPSGNAYNFAATYIMGQTVDLSVGSETRTFQAVRKSTGKPPNWGDSTTKGNICNNSNMNTCSWVQIPQSLSNGTGAPETVTFTGSYTVKANGSGVMTITIADCQGGDCSVQIAFVAPATSQVGQTVGMVGISSLTNSNNTTGSAVRIK